MYIWDHGNLSSQILNFRFSICMDLFNIFGCFMTIKIFSFSPVFSLVPSTSIFPQQFQTNSESK